ncbi:hypothetical protein AAFF_G00014570 [Aldrovandia affinis]|uniref:Uncharacterized protein n=1 Tax=Aldrovandia affinis TaxID=143900 RepID=A0AAD7R370_9TELE|nr:hypothetical protein AAFF_G00014570 [Aldrovandia affinis]
MASGDNITNNNITVPIYKGYALPHTIPLLPTMIPAEPDHLDVTASPLRALSALVKVLLPIPPQLLALAPPAEKTEAPSFPDERVTAEKGLADPRTPFEEFAATAFFRRELEASKQRGKRRRA